MQNETQNQDTQAAPQQPVMEEAQAAPQQAMDDAQAATSEVHDDPGIPQQQEQQGIAVGEPDPSSPGGEPVSEEALGIGIEDISAMPSASDLFGNDDFLSTVEMDDDWGSTNSEWTISEDYEVIFPTVSDNDDWSSTNSEQKGPLSGDTDGNGIDDIGEHILEDDWNPRDHSFFPEGEDWSWDSEPSDTEVVSESPPPEAVSMPIDKIVDPAPTDQVEVLEVLPGDSGEEGEGPGYDGSGIAGGLDLDQNGVFDQTENNPDILQPDLPGNDPAGQHEGNVIPDEKGTNPDASEGEGYTYDEGAYEDAEDALENLQDALQDGDEEDLAEALEELQGYLGGFDKGNAEDENPDPTGGAGPEEAKDATGDDPAAGANAQEDPEDPGQGVMEDEGEGGTNPSDVDYQEVLHDLDSGNLDDVREFLEGLAGGGNDEEEEAKDAPGASHEHGHLANESISLDDIVGEKDEYAYDEEAYEDAEDAFKDLRHALKHGDEEDRAEALQKLQGYLGGFDKGAEDEDPDLTGGDAEKVSNTVDKEPVDAPDASGAAVSGAAVGTTAAVGAGAVGEAIDAATKQAGGAIDDALGIEGSGKILDDVVDGDFDEALGAVTGLAGGAIDDALGIEGSGEVLDGVVDGDWDKVTDALPDLVEEGVEKYFGVEGAGEALDDIFEGDWDELGDHLGEAAGSIVGNYFGGPVGAEIGGKIGEFVGDGVGDAVTEELGDIATHIENGDYDELAGDALALGAGTVGGLIFGDDGAAVGQEIGEAVGDAASEVVEEVGEVFEDVGDAVGGFVEDVGDLLPDIDNPFW